MNAQHEGNIWQLQEAKAMLSQVVKLAADAPQIITNRGVEAAVILSMEDYRELKGIKPSFIQAFRNRPYPELELEAPEYLPDEEIQEIDW